MAHAALLRKRPLSVLIPALFLTAALSGAAPMAEAQIKTGVDEPAETKPSPEQPGPPVAQFEARSELQANQEHKEQPAVAERQEQPAPPAEPQEKPGPSPAPAQETAAGTAR